MAVDSANGYLYIAGAYKGYTDGTLSDTTQGFVSRLFLGDISTAVQEPQAKPAAQFTLYPNPANAYVQLNYNCGTATTTHGLIVVREISGRTVATLPMAGNVGQQVLDTRTLAAGSYLVAFTNGATTLHTEKLIVQP
jgi:hypothetical protein